MSSLEEVLKTSNQRNKTLFSTSKSKNTLERINLYFALIRIDKIHGLIHLLVTFFQ